jgi:putative PEP-CTERM system TPR-repeat lipoprotein
LCWLTLVHLKFWELLEMQRTWLVTAAGLTLSAWMALAGCSPRESVEELIARSESALDRGELREAIIDAKTALQRNPENALARTILGEAYMRQQNFLEAADEFRRAYTAEYKAATQVSWAQAMVAAGQSVELLETYDADAESPVATQPGYQAAIARAQLSTGSSEDALQTLTAAIVAAPNDPYVATTRAMYLLRTGASREEATSILEAVTESHPEFADAWSMRGDVAQIEGQLEEAAEFYDRAVAINQFRLADRLKLIGALIENSDLDEAKSRLASLEKRAPNHPGVSFAKARLLLNDESDKAALEELNRVLSVLPAHAPSLYLAALANSREGNLATAQAQLEQFLSLYPENVDARVELARIYLRAREPGSAEYQARRVLEEDAMNTAALRALALALSLQGLNTESAEVYGELAILQPDSVSARMGVGSQLLLAGDEVVGIEKFREALAIDPDNRTAREGLIAAYLNLGRLVEARQEAQTYSARYEDNPRPLLLLGAVELRAEDRVSARAAFQQALELDPENIAGYRGLATLALQAGEIDVARSNYRRALSVAPEDLATTLSLATLELRAGELEVAEAMLEEAIELQPDALPPRLLLSQLLLSQGRASDAVAVLAVVRDLHDEVPALHEMLVRAYVAAGQPELATSSAETMLRLRPDDVDTLIFVAGVDIFSGREEQARERIQAAIELEPENLQAQKLAIDFLIRTGDFDDAVEALDALPDYAREAPDVLVAQGRLAMTQGRTRDAVAFFEEALQKQPTDGILLMLSSARWSLGRRDEVISSLEAWLNDRPGDSSVRLDLASRYLMVGMSDAAKDEYNVLLQAAPDNVTILNNLAWLVRNDEPDRALELIEKADELASGSGDVKDTYSMVLRARGDLDRALKLNDKALAIDPRNPEIRFHRALILADLDRVEEAVELVDEILAGPEFSSSEAARKFREKLPAR